MLLSERKVAELYARLEKFGVDVYTLKRSGLSAGQLEVLYYAVQLVDLHRTRHNRPKLHGLA